MLALAAGTVGAPGASGAAAKRYAPPYAMGPSGGDSWNVVHNDPATGRIVVGRAYPIPAVLNCGGQSAYQQQRVKHRVAGPVSKVTVSYSDAATDGYTFLNVHVRDPKGRFIGSVQRRGPLLNSGAVTAAVNGRTLKKGTMLTIDFGLTVSSACPSADGGTVLLPSVTVS